MNNEETIFDGGSVKEENEAKVNRKNNSNAIKMAAMAAGGVAVGVGASYASQASAANTTDTTEVSESTDATPDVMDSTPRVAIIDESKDFTSAFNEARDEVGAGGVFEYHGKLYNTYTEEEWDNMSQEEKNAFAQQVQPDAQQVEANYQAEVHVVHTSQPEVHSTAEHHSATEVHPVVENTDASEDNEIHVLAVEHDVDMNGETVDVAAIEIDGHQGLLIDVDQNGTADVAAIDINNNGQLDQGEVRDISQAYVQMPQQTPGDMYMASADDMPDYTNDSPLI